MDRKAYKTHQQSSLFAQKRAEEPYASRGKTLYCIQDTAAAIQNILLAACSMGLGTCWMGAFKEDEGKKVINAPAHMRPVALIPVGYPSETPNARPRRPLSGIMHEEKLKGFRQTKKEKVVC